MQDSRVALKVGDLWQAASDELQWLISLGDFVWNTFEMICGVPAAELKSRSIRAGHIAYHFMWRRILQPAGELPWRLVCGDLQQNLLQLKEEECPDEPVSSQLWELMHAGYPMPMLVSVLEALGQAGWTAVPAEQQHGSLAQFKRWHPDYGVQTLLSRAMLSHISRLLPVQAAGTGRSNRVLNTVNRLLLAGTGIKLAITWTATCRGIPKMPRPVC